MIRAQATAGRAPEWFSLAPIDAVRKVLAKAGWSLDTVDLFELNEAFSVQALAVIRELGLDQARVNVNGGAVAIGHPIGASGAAVLVKLVYAMADRGAKRGVAALCLGGGNAVALAVERAVDPRASENCLVPRPLSRDYSRQKCPESNNRSLQPVILHQSVTGPGYNLFIFRVLKTASPFGMASAPSLA